MLLSRLLGTAALAVGCRAQGSPTAGSGPTPTSSMPATTHTISVGGAGFKFTPENLTAEVGDVVEFRFYPTGHSVVRAELGYPCIPYEYVELNRKGFYSGIQNVQAILSNVRPRGSSLHTHPDLS